MPQAPAQPQQVGIEDVIRAEATRQGVPPELALAVAQTESSLNPLTKPSSAGAIGTFQLMPETAKRHGVDPYDHVQNIKGGIAELKDLIGRHPNDLQQVLREYNASPGAARELTDPYVQKALGNLRQYAQRPSAGGGRGVGPGAIGSSFGAGGGRGGPPSVQSRIGTPPPSSEAFTRELTPMESTERLLESGVRSAATALDPRTTTGRQNWAGMGGGIAGGVVGGPPGAVIGASLGGEAAELGEQVAGTKPPSTSAAFGAAATQGTQEALGQALPWAVRASRQQLVAGTVAKTARESLFGTRAGEAGTVADALQAGRDLPSVLRDRPRPSGLPPVRGMGGTEAFTSSLVAQPPSAGVTGRAAEEILRGPSADAKALAGKAVEDAAESGPDVSLADLKAQVRAMVAKATPPRGPEGPGAGYLKNVAAASTGSGAATTADQASFAAALRRAGVNVEETHPLPGVLSAIDHAPDTVRFAEAHRLKRTLDEAINWESPAKKQVQQIAKATRNSLRDTMRGYAPYDKATAAYEKIVPLYDEEYVPKFLAQAQTNPESLVQMISPTDATPLRMLREVLVDQAAKVGKGAEGQQAWNAVRAGLTYRDLLKGGFKSLDKNLAEIDPEVAQVLFGDRQGQEVFHNLQTLAAGYKATAAKFGESHLSGLSGEQMAAHLARGALGPPFGLWTMLSRAKLLVGGPAEKDLIEWAAYSPENTRRAVYWMTGTPASGLVLADMIRAGVPQTVLKALDTRKTGLQPATVGQPPPR